MAIRRRCAPSSGPPVPATARASWPLFVAPPASETPRIGSKRATALCMWEVSVGGSFRPGKRKRSTADRFAPSGPALLMRLPGGLIPFANGRDPTSLR